MKVLVTGGTGFIGGFVREHLSGRGMDVMTLTRSLPSGNAAGFVEGSLADGNFLDGFFGRERFDAVVHLAWNGVSSKRRDEAAQFENFEWGNGLLSACAKHGIKTFTGLGSQAEYGPSHKMISEDSLVRPTSLYGIAKLASGYSGLHYSRTAGFNYAWLRLFPTFGPRDSRDFVIPYAIGCFLKGERPKLTPCRQLMDFIYVRDISRHIERVLTHPGKFQDIYNLCSGKAVRLSRMITKLGRFAGPGVRPDFGAVAYRGDGFMKVLGDPGKFRRTFGAVRLTPFEEALEETVEWYRGRTNAAG